MINSPSARNRRNPEPLLRDVGSDAPSYKGEERPRHGDMTHGACAHDLAKQRRWGLEYRRIRRMEVKLSRGLGVFACFSALLLLAVAIASGAHAGVKPKIDGAWIKLPVIAGRPAVAYATIVGADKADQLLRVEGQGPAKYELHTSRDEGGVMRMAAVDAVDVPANGRVELKPGGLHVMIFGMPATKPGAMVPVTFVFRNAGKISVNAHAMAAGDGGHTHH